MATERRPVEQEAVRTTIVGGRPPGSGKPLGPIPRGIEVLVKKAAVDPEFKCLLLEKRGEAAKAIGLALEPAESLMLAAAPAAQIEAIIAQTNVSPSLRPAFLGRAAAVMLAALGVGLTAVAVRNAVAGVVAKDLPSVSAARPACGQADRPGGVGRRLGGRGGRHPGGHSQGVPGGDFRIVGPARRIGQGRPHQRGARCRRRSPVAPGPERG